MLSFSIGGVLGIIIWGYTFAFLSWITGRILIFPAVLIEIGRFVGVKTSENEKRKWRKADKSKMIPIILHAKAKGKSMKDEQLLAWGSIGLNFLLYLVLLIILLAAFGSDVFQEGKGFLSGIVITALALNVIVIISQIIIMYSPANRELLRLSNQQMEDLHNGTSFAELQVYQGLASNGAASKAMRLFHLNMCVNKALDRGDYQVLPGYLSTMDSLLMTANGYDRSVNYMGCYYNMLFYSSYIYRNVPNAVKIYQLIKDYLEADMEPNGRRVLAFYQYFIAGKPNLAAASLYQAEEALRTVNMNIYTEAEKNLDKKYIKELRTRMANDSRVNSHENPIMRYEV